jgi:acyl-coenzyme A thioesterase PaaI-like protein
VGVVAAFDTACGYAALTLMPDDTEVLTVELRSPALYLAPGHALDDVRA